MTATDELRRMLDERGVEWMPSVWSAKDETFYKVGEVGYLATELSSGKMKVCIEGYPTPAQAIAATLGSSNCTNDERMNGTCHVRATTRLGDSWFGFKLSCGHSMVNPFNDRPDYCPWCGAKVVGE